MSFSEEPRDNKIYLAVAIFIIIVIILTIFLSNNKLIIAKIEDDILGNSWIEDIREREFGSSSFGLEKWASFTYKNNNVTYPAYITVTSLKTLFMINEVELKNKMEETIKDSNKKGILIDLESEITGERTLFSGHKTFYSVYNGSYSNNDVNEKIKIIGETWNCGASDTSIICIGYAQITDYAHNNSENNFTYWIEILKDIKGTFGLDYKGSQGLLFNVKCH